MTKITEKPSLFSGNVVCCGLDVHKKYFHSSCAQFGELIKSYGIKKYDGTLFEKCYGVIEGLKKVKADNYIIIYEAGCFGYSIRDAFYTLFSTLKIKNIKVEIAAPSLIEQAPGNKVKTDNLDSKKLSIDASVGRLKYIYQLNSEERSYRTFVRTRHQLSKDFRRKKIQIRSFLLIEGIETEKEYSTWTLKFEKYLNELEFTHPLVDEAFEELLQSYKDIKKQMIRINNRIKEIGESESIKEDVKRMESVFGIGVLSSLTILSELGFKINERFENSKKFASFIGLVPSEHSSGEGERKGHITRCGNSRIRWILVEASWLLIRKDLNLQKKFNKIAYKVGRKKAIIAIARTLSTRLHAMFRKGENYKMVLAA